MPRSGWEPRGGISQTLRGSRPGQLTEMENRRASPHFARHSLLGCNTFFAHQDRGAINHPHPSLKPQSFMRQIVRASLPLGEGVVLDPFTGGGSTIAAAIAVGYQSIGIEL